MHPHPYSPLGRFWRGVVPFLLLSPAFSSFAGSYSQNFTFGNGTTALGDGSTVAGNTAGVTSVQNGRLRLTAAGTGNSLGAYRLPILDPGKEVAEFTFQFDLTLNRVSGQNPADGFALSFGAIPQPPPSAVTDYGPGEGGWSLSGGLTVAFDTYDNGSDPQSIDVVANGVVVRNVLMSSFAPGGNYLNLFDNTARTVVIHYDEQGLDVTYGGNVIGTNLPVPGFVPAPGNYFGFTARTGGATEDVFLDNVSVTTVPVAPLETGGPVLNEVLVDNVETNEDEDCESGAWVELYNGSASAVNLAGWTLTDDVATPAKWTFPSVSVPAYGYLLVWTDSKDRTTGTLHTNFTLSKDGGAVSLYRPGAELVGTLTFGGTGEDVSYGALGNARTLGYLETPTPGIKNSGIQSSGAPVLEDVAFSRTGGLLTDPVTLTITPPTIPDAVIRYTTDNTAPTATSSVWPGAGLVLNSPGTSGAINTSVNIRARIFVPDRLPGPISSRTFIPLDASLKNYRNSGQPFSSNLPIVVFHSFGNPVDSAGGNPGLRPFRYTYGLAIDRDPLNGDKAVINGPIDVQTRGGTHVRGETSAGFAQKPYAWEMWDNEDRDKPQKLLGWPAESDWVLISNYNDKSVIRNRLPFDMMRDINGQGAAMRERYVEVFFRQDANGPLSYNDYRGVYVLTEKIKRDNERVDIERLRPCDGVYTGNPAVDDVGIISGGYIVRKDKPSPEQSITVSPSGQVLQMVEPNDPTTAQLNYMKNYMDRFEAALNGANFANPTTGYAKYIDVDSFIENHLWVEMFKQIDGYRLSTYYSKDRGGKLKSRPLWDYNLSQGNADYPAGNEGADPTKWYYSAVGGADYPWYGRLFQDPNFVVKYWDRYWKLRRSEFSDAAVMARIDALASDLSNDLSTIVTNGSGTWPNSTPAAESPIGRHNARWQRLGLYDWPNAAGYNLRTRWNPTTPFDYTTVTATTAPGSATSELTHVKTWMLRRLMWMDDQSLTFNSTTRNVKPPVLTQYTGNVPSGFSLGVSNPNGAGTIYYTTDGTDPRPANGAAPAGGTPNLGGSSSAVWISENGSCDYLVPSVDNGGSTLTLVQNDANQWNGLADPPNYANWQQNKPLGLGFKTTSTLFDPYIGSNTDAAMRNVNGTVYVRTKFTVTQPQIDGLVNLKLRVRFDDAYIAYLNGVEVARRVYATNGVPTWNTVANAVNSDATAVVFQDVPLISFKNLLQPGENVLAFHGMNATASSNDFLLQPRLEAEFAAVIPLTQTVAFKMRTFDSSTNLWSPLTEASFAVNAAPASAQNLVISEINYHPVDATPDEIAAGFADGNDFEFIELLNISGGEIDLDRIAFTEGITFDWLEASVRTIPAGGRVVLVENAGAFAMRYAGSGAVVAGVFSGNLANGGETLRLVAANGDDIRNFTYDDADPWPVAADGGGATLVLVNPLSNPDHNVATNWRASGTSGGKPGQPDGSPYTGSPTADTDGDGVSDFLEWFMGTVGNDAGSHKQPALATATVEVNGTPGSYLTFSFQRSLEIEGATGTPEACTDLIDWENGPALVFVGSTPNGDGTVTDTWRTADPVGSLPERVFVRLNVTTP